ncbi:hypothetical protein SERLA73DRAFT_96145 [Serpula lacrymans var. lacrymans S7.3]|uniref:NAD(P)-binding protein n=2 Tax=Serpula lacrymans var. lacrymans TaxID=341189 RepID=F8QAK2_SERL3|nr:uncharacterized protein SERLADRAFT_452978 [Serpula lacrymans var. lacrymans S7.9]EGN94792.1 hypothetical protein SERLA73DRAFT_96145 [Serpula lacrymans var. lacrymans S7.3]EGO20290.1 hypothetical protein SERLADRAFT_452978 [Serpula lacrymans var. lacrymans S7.9]
MGNFWSLVQETFPPTSKFGIDDIPDMTGKVVIVTGGNTGIGKETARVLLLKNARVYITSRDHKKGEYAAKELLERTGKEVHVLRLDLASLKSVKAGAEYFLNQETKLHVLFNNAGVANCPVNLVTEDGYDLQFGTNVLGHFYFTKFLLPVLLSTAKSSPDGIARVVNTSSSAHHLSGLHFNTFKDSPARREMSSARLYGQSKTGNIVFAAELTRRYGQQGIVSTALNPGGIRTELSRHSSNLFTMLVDVLLYDVSYGALTQLYAGTIPDGASLNGKYLIPWARVGRPVASTQDLQLGKELWTWLEEQVQDV